MKYILLILLPALLNAARFANGFGHLPAVPAPVLFYVIIFAVALYYFIKSIIIGRRKAKTYEHEKKAKKIKDELEKCNLDLFNSFIIKTLESKKEISIDEIYSSLDLSQTTINEIINTYDYAFIIKINNYEFTSTEAEKKVTRKRPICIKNGKITRRVRDLRDLHKINIVEKNKINTVTEILQSNITELNTDSEAKMYDSEGNPLILEKSKDTSSNTENYAHLKEELIRIIDEDDIP